MYVAFDISEPRIWENDPAKVSDGFVWKWGIKCPI